MRARVALAAATLSLLAAASAAALPPRHPALWDRQSIAIAQAYWQTPCDPIVQEGPPPYALEPGMTWADYQSTETGSCQPGSPTPIIWFNDDGLMMLLERWAPVETCYAITHEMGNLLGHVDGDGSIYPVMYEDPLNPAHPVLATAVPACARLLRIDAQRRPRLAGRPQRQR